MWTWHSYRSRLFLHKVVARHTATKHFCWQIVLLDGFITEPKEAFARRVLQFRFLHIVRLSCDENGMTEIRILLGTTIKEYRFIASINARNEWRLRWLESPANLSPLALGWARRKFAVTFSGLLIGCRKLSKRITLLEIATFCLIKQLLVRQVVSNIEPAGWINGFCVFFGFFCLKNVVAPLRIESWFEQQL